MNWSYSFLLLNILLTGPDYDYIMLPPPLPPSSSSAKFIRLVGPLFVFMVPSDISSRCYEGSVLAIVSFYTLLIFYPLIFRIIKPIIKHIIKASTTTHAIIMVTKAPEAHTLCSKKQEY